MITKFAKMPALPLCFHNSRDIGGTLAAYLIDKFLSAKHLFFRHRPLRFGFHRVVDSTEIYEKPE